VVDVPVAGQVDVFHDLVLQIGQALFFNWSILNGRVVDGLLFLLILSLLLLLLLRLFWLFARGCPFAGTLAFVFYLLRRGHFFCGGWLVNDRTDFKIF